MAGGHDGQGMPQSRGLIRTPFDAFSWRLTASATEYCSSPGLGLPNNLGHEAETGRQGRVSLNFRYSLANHSIQCLAMRYDAQEYTQQGGGHG